MEESLIEDRSVAKKDLDKLTALSEKDLEDIEKGAETAMGPGEAIPNRLFWRVMAAAVTISRRDIDMKIPLKDFQLVAALGEESTKLGLVVHGKPVYPPDIQEWGALGPPDALLDKEFKGIFPNIGRGMPNT